MEKSTIKELFPFDSFREKQYETTKATLEALYENGYNNVVIDAPVGVGKSGINVAALRYAEDGFYTTPQSSLRQQIQNDNVLNEHIKTLQARADYTCKVSGKDCDKCPVNNSAKESCSTYGSRCTYWGAKMAAMSHPIAVTTFSYLIIDGMLPTEVDGTPISFENRELIVVDEAQELASQCVSLHAGFKISPYTMPFDIFKNLTRGVSSNDTTYANVEDVVDKALIRCTNFIDDVEMENMDPEHKQCKNLIRKIHWMKSEIDKGNHWVCDVDTTKYAKQKHKTIELRPIDVRNFLKNNIWSRADKRIVSTATLPYRGRPNIWLRKVGLDPDETKVISVGMPFPKENRPIHTSTMIGEMSSGGVDKYWNDIMQSLNDIAKRHYNQKGLVHTASYDRAERVKETVEANKDKYPYLHDNIIVHKGERDSKVFVEDWQQSDHDMVLSPSMMEGVDLKGDKGRYQVLLKVPLGVQDSRTEYILENMDWGWNWYFEEAMVKVAQSYGRTIRSKTDKADYYVLDKDFDKLLSRRKAPMWLKEAIDIKEPDTPSIFDY